MSNGSTTPGKPLWLLQMGTFTKDLFLGSSCATKATLTCTGTRCKAHSLPSSVKDHVEALHHGSTNHQCICGRGDTKTVALIIETSSHHGLNVELFVEEPKERHRTKNGLDKSLKLEVLLCSEPPKGEGRQNDIWNMRSKVSQSRPCTPTRAAQQNQHC